MSQADICTTLIRSRRAVLAGIASAAVLPIAVAVPTAAALPAEAVTDPIFAALEAFRSADAAFYADVSGDIPDAIGNRWSQAVDDVISTQPTTPAGLGALTSFARDMAERSNRGDAGFGDRQWAPVAAAIDDATRGMSGLEPWSPPPQVDAELIALGRQYEPLVDRYYVAQRRWSGTLAQAHAEHDREFGDPADRNYEYPPEIVAAFNSSCERSGASEAGNVLSAIYKEMKPLANAINAASVNSIEGLRAKALVAFWEVAPLGAGNTEFSFEDAYPFQQLFTAVAEVCGLKDKMVATGYELPDIAMVDDDSDDNSDDEGEEA